MFHAGDQGLVEQQPLHPGGALAQPGDERVVVELRVHRVPGDVRDLGRQLRPAGGDRQAAEHPLVHEPELVGAVERQPDPQVSFGEGGRRLHEQLAAHAEVGQEGVAVVERQPQVLAAAPGLLDAPAGQPGREVVGAGGVAPYRTGMQYVDRGDGAADHVGLEAEADDLDLGQHVRRRASGAPSPWG